MIDRVHMVILLEPDLDAAVAFFKRIGGKLALKFHLKDRWVEFDLQGVKIGICPTSQAVEEHRTGIVLRSTGLHEMYEKHQKDFGFVGEPVVKPHGIMAGIKTPGGNVIDLYEETPEVLRDLIDRVKDQAGCEGETCDDEQDSCCQHIEEDASA